MKKRILSALLLAAMLVSLVACGGDSDTNDDKETKDTTGTETTLPAGIEKQDYDGEINILYPNWGLYQNYFVAGDDLTDVMNKALYNRETKVEDYLGVDIEYQRVETILDIAPALAQSASTNDDLYQIALTHCATDIASMITAGSVTDMNRLGIDFEGEWFDQNSNEALEVFGKQFYAVSDYMLPDPNIVLFNKELIDRNDLEDPYQLVRDGKWTLDKMTEMASKATNDSDGNNTMDFRDTYGFTAPSGWYLSSFIFGADVSVVDRTEDGAFEVVFGDDRSYTLMEKLDKLLNGPDCLVFEDFDNARAIPIESNRCLFTLNSFTNFHLMRDVTTEFGILPYPMLDENQDGYVSNDWSGLMCVPYSVKESSYDMVGDVIELLAYYSEEEVVPSYIEDTLGLKHSRDDESIEMINLVFDSVRFDAALNYFLFADGNLELFYAPQYMLVDTKQNTFSSWLATYKPEAQAYIDNFNDVAIDIEG